MKNEEQENMCPDTSKSDLSGIDKKVFTFFSYIKLLYQSTIQKLVNFSGFTEKIVSAIVVNIFSNLIFLPLFSIALFVIYMAHYHFFSYDFFIEGMFGMKLFVLTAVVLLAILSMALFASILMLYANTQKENEFPKLMVLVTGICNILAISALVIISYEAKNSDLRMFVIVIAAVALYLAIHLGVLIYSKNNNMKPLPLMIVLYALTVFFIIVFPGHAIRLLEIPLRGFGVGNVAVEIQSQHEKYTVQLILLSPNKVYYIENYCPRDDRYNVVSQSLEEVRVKRVFGHEWSCDKPSRS